MKKMFILFIKGDVVLKVSAYDGDYANPRKLRYEFSEESNTLQASRQNTNSQILSYFKMNPDTGVLSLRKDIQVKRIVLI